MVFWTLARGRGKRPPRGAHGLGMRLSRESLSVRNFLFSVTFTSGKLPTYVNVIRPQPPLPNPRDALDQPPNDGPSPTRPCRRRTVRSTYDPIRYRA